MPEGPEVNIIKVGVNHNLKNKIIIGFFNIEIFFNYSNFLKSSIIFKI
jgi:hypothetical protein